MPTGRHMTPCSMVPVLSHLQRWGTLAPRSIDADDGEGTIVTPSEW
jgi:hypothetical protein